METLASSTPSEFDGKNVILNIFPSIDTPTCATSVRQFNERAAGMDETVVLCVSADLPFAQDRFCGAEGIENVKIGVHLPLRLRSMRTASRSPMVPSLVCSPAPSWSIGPDGTVKHTELVSEIAQEPDYDAALAAL